MKKYIYVLDSELAAVLMDDGYKPLSVVNSDKIKIWVFENSARIKFSKDDSQKVQYSDTLRMCF